MNREIIASAHEYIQNWKPSDFGRKGTKDPNEMCRYCKNEDTEAVRDAGTLNEYKKFFKDIVHKVYYCHCCGVTSSWYKKPDDWK
jgi:hypothetical protein